MVTGEHFDSDFYKAVNRQQECQPYLCRDLGSGHLHANPQQLVETLRVIGENRPHQPLGLPDWSERLTNTLYEDLSVGRYYDYLKIDKGPYDAQIDAESMSDALHLIRKVEIRFGVIRGVMHHMVLGKKVPSNYRWVLDFSNRDGFKDFSLATLGIVWHDSLLQGQKIEKERYRDVTAGALHNLSSQVDGKRLAKIAESLHGGFIGSVYTPVRESFQKGDK